MPGTRPGMTSERKLIMKLPQDIGPIHFVGIGGIGMSGIAEVLRNLGYTVQGSDVADSANVKRLRDHGIQVSIGHDAKNIAGAAVLVVSSAIKRDNPELIAARGQRLPVVRRAEMLAELMRLKRCVAIAGTHGKTTTTSMVATLLAGLDPTVINGGIINAYGTNARLGAGDWMVVEADESDGTFLKLPADIAIVTNVDAEHLDHFKTFEAVQQAFIAFVENVPFYGFSVMCTDHPTVHQLVGRIEDRRIITYGENPQADVRLADLTSANGQSRFNVLFRDRSGGVVHQIRDLVLPMPGRHNALNATAAVAIAYELGISDEQIKKALAGFGGVKRRFTRTGEWNGVTVIDDYGHHPVEIAAVLRAARESTEGHVIAIVQPHRYTRLQSLFEDFSTCFNDANAVVVANVYPAGEAPIPGVDRDALVQGLRARGHRQVLPLDDAKQLAPMIKEMAKPGDTVVFLGAGNITSWAYALPDELKALG
jgi:UDP-N-acetylmuramate--alanine ligase